jgi:hypothetical protein
MPWSENIRAKIKFRLLAAIRFGPATQRRAIAGRKLSRPLGDGHHDKQAYLGDPRRTGLERDKTTNSDYRSRAEDNGHSRFNGRKVSAKER